MLLCNRNALALVLVCSLGGAAGCGADAGGDQSAATAAAERAAAGDAGQADRATVDLGDRSWTFSDVRCSLLTSGEFVQAGPSDSDDATVRFEAVHEGDGRSAATIRDADGGFQYSVGEGGPAPVVTIDGRTVTFEGTFVSDYGTGEQLAGRIVLQC